MKHVVVTGASSGIGLEFVQQFLDSGARVIAGSRSAPRSEELADLASTHGDRLVIRAIDVGDAGSRSDFADVVRERFESLDVLVNAAGIIAGDEETISVFGALDQDELARTFLINSIAPLMMTELVYPLLVEGDRPIVVNISSLNGSIALWDRRGKYSYCASKAALNMITKTLSIELRDAGVRVIAFHPGWVKTWMTRHEPAPMEPADSVEGMMRLIETLTPEASGSFLAWNGEAVPW